MQTVSIAILAALGATSAPQPSCPTPGLTPVEVQRIYCCTLASGQQCCAGSVDADGKPEGCGC